MKKSLMIAGVVALATPFLIAANKPAQTLRLNIKPGQVITMKSNSTSSSDNPMGGEPTEIKTDMTQTITIGDESEGWNKFTIKTTDFKMTGADDMITMGADPAAIAESAKKEVSTGEVNERGQVRNMKTEGGSEGGMSLDFAGPEVMGLLGFMYPEEEVEKGSSWNTTLDLGKAISKTADGQIDNAQGSLKTTYTVDDIVEKDGKTLVNLSISAKGSATFTILQLGSDGSVTVTGTGKLVVDLETGVPVSGNAKTTADVDLGMFQIKQSDSTKSTFTIK